MASTACEGLCRWLLAIEKYDIVAKVVAPKRIALKSAEDALQTAMSKLEAKRAMLLEVQQKLAKLQDNLETNKKKKVRFDNSKERLFFFVLAKMKLQTYEMSAGYIVSGCIYMLRCKIN